MAENWFQSSVYKPDSKPYCKFYYHHWWMYVYVTVQQISLSSIVLSRSLYFIEFILLCYVWHFIQYNKSPAICGLIFSDFVGHILKASNKIFKEIIIKNYFLYCYNKFSMVGSVGSTKEVVCKKHFIWNFLYFLPIAYCDV